MKGLSLLIVSVLMVAVSAYGSWKHHYEDDNEHRSGHHHHWDSHERDRDHFRYSRHRGHGHHRDHHGDRKHGRYHSRSGSDESHSGSDETRSGSYESHESREEHDRDEVYRFMVGDSWGPYEYIDEEGYLKGFHVDILLAVCQHAGKHCHYIRDTYHNCWNTEGWDELPGTGLLSTWYDGCVGMFPSPERLNSFNFTLTFTPDIDASLFYRNDEENEHPEDITGKKVGFVDGFAVGRPCLMRQKELKGNHEGEFTGVEFHTHKEMVKALTDKEIDTMLSITVFDKKGIEAHSAGPHFKCTLGGLAVMTHYGSPVLEWWNKAFDEMQESGEFAKVCKESRKTHGDRGNINCL